VLNSLNNFQEIIGIVVEVLKNKEEILLRHDKNATNENFRRFPRNGQGDCFDKVVLEWFNCVGNKNVPVSEPMVQAKPKALEVAR